MSGMIIGGLLALALGVLITRSINRALRQVIEGLSDGAQEVAAAAGQVSAAAQSLAEGSSEQAASLEETSSSLEGDVLHDQPQRRQRHDRPTP